MHKEILQKASFEIKIVRHDKEIGKIEGIGYVAALAICEDVRARYIDDKEFIKALDSVLNNFGFCGESGPGYNIHVFAKMPRIKEGEKQTCPRRTGEVGPWKNEEGADTWETVGTDKVCSFCGSLHPDRVLELVRERGIDIIEQTDKGYKWYIQRPEIPNAGFGGIKFYKMHADEAFWTEIKKMVDADVLKKHLEKYTGSPPA